MKQYYIKVGKRYKPVKPFFGFPRDGVWIVRDAGKSTQWILFIDSEPTNLKELYDLAVTKVKLKDLLLQELLKVKQGQSIEQIADKVAEEVADKLIRDYM